MNKNIKIKPNSKQSHQRRGRRRLFPVYILGPLVFLVLSYFIYLQVTHQPNWRSSLDQICHAITGPHQWKLWLIVALMPLNWGIEARKWQLALRPVGGMPYLDAFRAIFTGATMASFTPNRMGEYLGRMLYVKEGRRISSISLTIVCSIAQLLVTLVVGMAGILYIHYSLHGSAAPLTGLQGSALPGVFTAPGALNGRLGFWLNLLLGLVTGLLIALTIIYFRLSWFVGVLSKVLIWKKYLPYIKVLENFDATILLRILFLSFGRYIVFIVQYCLVFPVFGVFLGVGQLWSGMSVVFLVMAVIPTFTFLTELGLRWEASIQILELFSANAVGIFAASFAIWLINLIIPALIGSLLIISIKLFKNR